MSAAVSWPDLRRQAVASAHLEWMLTDPMAFGMTSASPLQLAVCRIADGRPLGAVGKDPDVQAALSGGHGHPP